MEGFIERGEELIASFGYKVIAALLIFVIGRWAAKAGVRTEISAIVNVPRRTMPHSLAGEREGNLTLAKKSPGAGPGIYLYYQSPRNSRT